MRLLMQLRRPLQISLYRHRFFASLPAQAPSSADPLRSTSLGKNSPVASSSPSPKRTWLSPLPGSTSIYQVQSEQEHHAQLLFPKDTIFSNFFGIPGNIIADKTGYIRLLENGEFRYMFLRPRCWGKSTFLNMLEAYYDVSTANSFDHLFGTLDIGKNPTYSRNSHLILHFDFSTIDPQGCLTRIERKVSGNICQALHLFLDKYGKMLGNPSENDCIFPDDIARSLSTVLHLVCKKGYTTFVGVDEYDAPANTCLAHALKDRKNRSEGEWQILMLERLLKAEFFGVMKMACGKSIAKYWLTGVMPAFYDGISPAENISSLELYHGLCGFTQDDVDVIAAQTLAHFPKTSQSNILESLKHWYHGYKFCPTSQAFEDPSKYPLLYNPQIVLHHLQNRASDGNAMPYVDEVNAVYSRASLETCDDNGVVTPQDLLDLIDRGSVHTRVLPWISHHDLMQEGRDAGVTWSHLYYLGIVTHDSVPTCLRIPNAAMCVPVYRRIRNYLRANAQFLMQELDTYKSLKNGQTTPFIELLEGFLNNRSIRSISSCTEPNLGSVIEVYWLDEAQCIAQMRLLMDAKKKMGNGRYGFVDIFLGDPARVVGQENPILVLELKNVSLSSLWKATQKDRTVEPSANNLFTLVKALGDETEDQLLERKYAYFDKVSHQWHEKTVQNTLDDAIHQLRGYLKIISVGKGDRNNEGILDDRVRCRAGGLDVLCGYVVICIGGSRVVCRPVERVRTAHSFEIITSGSRQKTLDEIV